MINVEKAKINADFAEEKYKLKVAETELRKEKMRIRVIRTQKIRIEQQQLARECQPKRKKQAA